MVKYEMLIALLVVCLFVLKKFSVQVRLVKDKK